MDLTVINVEGRRSSAQTLAFIAVTKIARASSDVATSYTLISAGSPCVAHTLEIYGCSSETGPFSTSLT